MARAHEHDTVGPLKGSVSPKVMATALTFFICAVFVLGGSARADVSSLLLLRPLAAILLGFGLLSLTREQAGRFKILRWLGGAIFTLTLLHLIPLPPALWSSLPGRELVVDIFQEAGLARNWQPLTIDPFAGWNSLFALLVPAAALVLTASGGQSSGQRMIKMLCILVFVSGLLGLFQVMGGPSNGLYFYRITNWDSATGLFANRNHNAMFLACGFPMLAAWASSLGGTAQKQRAFTIVAAAGAVSLLPMILVTESRTGMLTGLIGLVAAGLIYRRPQQGAVMRGASQVTGFVMVGLAVLGALLTAALALFGSNTTFDRFMNESVGDDLRFAALPHIWRMAVEALPVGWGAGSFVTTYKIFEPNELLSENYLNHAHNDVLEVISDFGLLGAALMVFAFVLFVMAGLRMWSARRAASLPQTAERMRLGWAGLAVLFILGVGSLLDYPLRTPSLAALAVVAAGFVVFALDAIRDGGYCEPANLPPHGRD